MLGEQQEGRVKTCSN